jgi:hypothetical protein
MRSNGSQEARSENDGKAGGDFGGGGEQVGMANVFPALALGAS